MKIGSAVLWLAKAVIKKIRRSHFGHNNLLALRPTQCCVLAFQDLVDRVCKPALMPELKGETVSLRQELRKHPQQIRIGFQIRRCLDQYRPQPSRLSHWLHALQKKPKRVVAILEPLEMRDRLMHLGGKFEIRRRHANPSSDRAGRWHPPKRGIQLHRIQPRGIELKKPLRRQLLRKERRFPTRV